jgi:hypothetical protein
MAMPSAQPCHGTSRLTRRTHALDHSAQLCAAGVVSRCSLVSGAVARTSSARYCVICVVLPDPVSPMTTSICSGSHDSAAQPSATLRRHTRTAVGGDHNS